MDNNHISYANEENTYSQLNEENIVPPAGTHDTLKISNCRNFNLYAKEVHGGAEDVIDINRGEKIEVYINKAIPRGKFAATIKGGAKDVLLKIKCLAAHGTETDIDIGNYSEQSIFARTKNIKLNITTIDGSPVKVRVLHGHVPILLNGNTQKYIIDTKYKGMFIYIFYCYKKIIEIYKYFKNKLF